MQTRVRGELKTLLPQGRLLHAPAHGPHGAGHEDTEFREEGIIEGRALQQDWERASAVTRRIGTTETLVNSRKISCYSNSRHKYTILHAALNRRAWR
jgi:hypothetical protein